MDYVKDLAFAAINEEGETISVTKFGYRQEQAFIDESGKTYLQNPTTLELYEEEIDEDLVDERVTPESAGVITSVEPKANRKAKVADKNAKTRTLDAASEREAKDRELAAKK